MKSANSLSAFFICALAASVLSSCGSSVEIVKRKHNDGYYVHVNKSVKPADKAESQLVSSSSIDVSNNQNEGSLSNVSSISEKTAITDNSFIASESNQLLLVSKQRYSYDSNTDLISDLKVEKANYISSAQFKQIKKFGKISGETSSASRVDDVVLVICCLLLPPLAVYLKDGIGASFWLDLLLTFLFILPGVIYAFIVCFA